MRTIKKIEIRTGGWLFEKNKEVEDSGKEKIISARKIDAGSELYHLFDVLYFSDGLIFEDIIKMLKNYEYFQKLNPYIKNILDEYEEIRDIKVDKSSPYQVLLFEKHIVDTVDEFSEESGFFGLNVHEQDLRYELFYESMEYLIKLPVYVSNIINTYMDAENDINDSSMFEFYTLDLATMLKGLVFNLQEIGTREEKIKEKSEFVEELGSDLAKGKKKVKLSAVKKENKSSE
jgi:hypothetical protein